MRRVGAGRSTASLFVQLLTFTVVTLIASHVISLIVLLELRPPIPDFYRLSEVEQAMRGTAPVLADRAPLERTMRDAPPRPALDIRTAPAIRARLARDLNAPVERIVIAGDHGPLADRRVFRILRERAAKEGLREEHLLIAPFAVGIQQPDGRWMVVKPGATMALSPWERELITWFLLSSLAMAPVAYVYARRLSAPIGVLARAADRLGRDPQAPPLEVKGSSEIAAAARAFNDMQARLRRYVEDRTAMVGAVAHDLRTPLTRLRFRIESAPEEQRAKMITDIEQMEAMIAATLAFVRDASRAGERTPLELCSLVESVCDELAETGAEADVQRGEGPVVLEGDPMALRRLFANLVENAVKFGGRARARVFHEAGSAIVEIDDDGPGIPPAEVERVFEPFYRREPSRSRQTGGIGLGLAVVRTIARGHGGDVALVNRPGGGLTARVQLPL